MKRPLTMRELVNATGISKRSVERYLKKGLPCSRRKGVRYFNAAEVKAWMASKGKNGKRGQPSDMVRAAQVDLADGTVDPPAPLDVDATPTQRKILQAKLAKEIIQTKKLAQELKQMRERYESDEASQLERKRRAQAAREEIRLANDRNEMIRWGDLLSWWSAEVLAPMREALGELRRRFGPEALEIVVGPWEKAAEAVAEKAKPKDE